MEKQVTETLGEMLLREGVINHDQLEEALKRQKVTVEKSIGQILVDMGVITESVKMHFLQKKFGYELFRLNNKEIEPLLLSYIPKHYAQKYHVVPVGLDRGILVVAMDDPSDLNLLDNLKTTVGLSIRPVIASVADIDEILKQYPETKEEVFVLPKPRSALYKLIRYVFFPLMGFLPLVIFIILVKFNEKFLLYVTRVVQAGSSFSFDVFLYTLLGWGLWIIIVWEINGVIFEEKVPLQQSPSSEENEE
ncbi:hypothetical protein JW926_10065 [Candidatus Sumerlaeota bacterium]|nr:hypothetical protein [Candidatus Sumerlaeota bacterium]